MTTETTVFPANGAAVVTLDLAVTKNCVRLFSLIARCRQGNWPARIEPRMRKRRPMPYPWLKIPRVQARRKKTLHGHALGIKQVNVTL